MVPLVFVTVDVRVLRPDPLHARHLDPVEFALLRKSMSEHGILCPIIATRDGCVVVDGHERLQVAKSLGLHDVPVVFLELDLDFARVLGLNLNRVRGHWDVGLPRLLANLAAQELDLERTGFTHREITAQLQSGGFDQPLQRPEHFEP